MENDSYYMKLAEAKAEESTCLSRKVGVAVVGIKDFDGMVVSFCNYTPDGLPNCKDEGKCLRRSMGIPSCQRLELCRIIHAEMAAVAALSIDMEGSTMYVTSAPCNICAHLIVQVGVKKVVYKGGYPSDGLDVLRYGGVEVVKYEEVID